LGSPTCVAGDKIAASKCTLLLSALLSDMSEGVCKICQVWLRMHADRCSMPAWGCGCALAAPRTGYGAHPVNDAKLHGLIGVEVARPRDRALDLVLLLPDVPRQQAGLQRARNASGGEEHSRGLPSKQSMGHNCRFTVALIEQKQGQQSSE